MDSDAQNWDGLPGGDFIRQGLEDLAAARETEFALLVLLGEPRLRGVGVRFPSYRPSLRGPVGHALYDLLEEKYGDDAYGRYNSMLRRMNSFAHALEREQSARSSDGA